MTYTEHTAREYDERHAATERTVEQLERTAAQAAELAEHLQALARRARADLDDLRTAHLRHDAALHEQTADALLGLAT